jgi:hypothetical protein
MAISIAMTSPYLAFLRNDHVICPPVYARLSFPPARDLAGYSPSHAALNRSRRNIQTSNTRTETGKSHSSTRATGS